jgi:hypothetical protein
LGVLLDEEPCEERTEDEGESSAMVAGGQRVGSSEGVRACGRAGGERRAGVREAALWALGVLAGLLAVLVLGLGHVRAGAPMTRGLRRLEAGGCQRLEVRG